MLRAIKIALENNNPDLGHNSLVRVSEAIASKIAQIREKDIGIKKSNRIAIAGIAFTIFFGLLSTVLIFVV